MKKTLLLFGLVVGSFIYAQNVGIETDNPQYTLDVEGSVRLATPGTFVANSKPLGINNETKQVVALDVSEDGDPFHVRRYRFDYRRGFGVLYYDLGLDYNKYDVMLVQATLTMKTGNRPPYLAGMVVADKSPYGPEGNMQVFPTQQTKEYDNRLTRASLKSEPGGQHICVITTEVMPNGKMHVAQGALSNNLAYPDRPGQHNSVVYTPVVKNIVKATRNTNWFFEGGFKFTTTVEAQSSEWVVDVLVVNKNWIESRDIVEVNVGGDFKTLTKVRGTHPAVQ